MRLDLEPAQRVALVRRLFGRAVPYYDRLNRLLSLGRDSFWRRVAARRACVFQTGRLLDLAAGTGDLALALAAAWPEARVVAADFLWPMLRRAREKVQAARQTTRVLLTEADALALPFPDQSFDTVSMAFGLRNIPDRLGALREMRRVLVPGGRVLILEMSFPGRSLVRPVYDLYLNRLIPWLGGLLARDQAAYQYLADSIMDYHPPAEASGLLARAGLEKIGWAEFTFGVCVLHWAQRPL